MPLQIRGGFDKGLIRERRLGNDAICKHFEALDKLLSVSSQLGVVRRLQSHTFQGVFASGRTLSGVALTISDWVEIAISPRPSSANQADFL